VLVFLSSVYIRVATSCRLTSFMIVVMLLGERYKSEITLIWLLATTLSK